MGPKNHLIAFKLSSLEPLSKIISTKQTPISQDSQKGPDQHILCQKALSKKEAGTSVHLRDRQSPERITKQWNRIRTKILMNIPQK